MQIAVNQMLVCQHLHTEPLLKTSLVGMPLAIILADAKKPCYPLYLLVQLQGKRAGDATLEFSISADNGRKLVHRHQQKIKVGEQDPRIKSGELYSIVHARFLGALTFEAPGWFTFAVSIDGDVKRKFKLQVIEQKAAKP